MNVKELIEVLKSFPEDQEVELAIVAPVDHVPFAGATGFAARHEAPASVARRAGASVPLPNAVSSDAYARLAWSQPLKVTSSVPQELMSTCEGSNAAPKRAPTGR